MTEQETIQAAALLQDRTDRTETISTGGDDLALTAYWLDGGQKMFYTLAQVEEWLAERQRAKS